MSLCSSCHATIRWAKTPAGKNTPLDANPTTDGPLWLDAAGIARFVEDDTPLDVVRYNTHFASCPNADHHRRRSANAWRSR